MSPKPNTSSGANPWIWRTIALAVVVAALAYWFLPRSPIKLTEDHYAATLALYRVCNQQSTEGLDEIESWLMPDESAPVDSTSQASSASLSAIQAIIDEARQSRWQDAAKQCRELLDGQVKR